MPCGSGSILHCCGTESRMLDGEIQPVLILSVCRRQATCASSVAWPLCHHEIGDSVTLMNGCVRAILSTRCTVSRWHSHPARRRQPPSEAKSLCGLCLNCGEGHVETPVVISFTCLGLVCSGDGGGR
ncbi:hypothetical protein TcCL_ESM06429 [Trypanosoma cruzi]|nr:hypothetical protein TcCL_ESM06429 [Trypanosoma cruzi]